MSQEQFPEDLYVIVATHDDGLTAVNYYAASADPKGHAAHFPDRKVVKYVRIDCIGTPENGRGIDYVGL